MKQLVILSGKGGTGKTTVAGAFIKLAANKAFADCDVDAPNLHLLCNEIETMENSEFEGYKKAVKYDSECINCGRCQEVCKFNAISNGRVNTLKCEGCGVCEYFCSAAKVSGRPAIRLENNVSGYVRLSRVKGELFSHAELKMGNGASGKLVTEVRRKLYNSLTGEELIIIDGSPGIGCPVIASVTGVDMVLAVTEPTLSGLHDMERIVETARRFEAECVVCINKYDINPSITKEIEKYCARQNITVAGRIPYDPLVIKAVNNGKSVIEAEGSPAVSAVKDVWGCVYSKLFVKGDQHI